MLNLQNIYVQYGDRRLLDQVSFTVREKDRIGLTGRNGAGKSTMLKIIAGHNAPMQGNIAAPKDLTIGFLHQDMLLPKGKTVLEEAMTAFAKAQAMEKRLEEIQQEMEERTDYSSDSYMELIHELSELNDRLALIGGQSLQAEAEKILMGLGFSVNDFDRQTTTFSGGWQMRIELAKILLQRPQLLLLDEPTNHLDIESIIWLEQFLQPYEGAVIVISHDKAFLDKVTQRTIEIELGKVHDYKANYSRYLELRDERQAQMQSAFQQQQKEIARKEALVDKFRAKANKAKMAQSLMKELDRMQRIELEDGDSSRMRLQFPPAPRSGERVAIVKGLSKSYGDNLILNEVDLTIIRGERLAFMGKNGEGKSTLVKIMVGQQLPTGGTSELGHNVHLGYYAQNQAEALDPKKTVLETIEQDAPFELRPRLRAILGSFLFRGEDVDKKVSVLSGGERARLAMACLLLHPINLLVLDEPTNHLDMLSKAILKEALLHYDGTLVVVSHDRDFLDGLTDKVIEFDQKKLKTYLGDSEYFLEKRQYGSLRDVSLGKTANSSGSSKKAKPKKDENDPAVKQALKQLKRNIQNAERQLQRLEEEKNKWEKILGDTDKFGTPDYEKALVKHQENQAATEEAMEKWEEAELALEAFWEED